MLSAFNVAIYDHKCSRDGHDLAIVKIPHVCGADAPSNGVYLLSHSNGSWRTEVEKGEGNSASNSGLPDKHIDAFKIAQNKCMLSDCYFSEGGCIHHALSGGYY